MKNLLFPIAILFLGLSFVGCEEEYDKSQIYYADIDTFNRTDYYVIASGRTLCSNNWRDTIPPQSRSRKRLLIWDAHYSTPETKVYTPAEFILRYYQGTTTSGRLVLKEVDKEPTVIYYKRIEPNEIWSLNTES